MEVVSSVGSEMLLVFIGALAGGLLVYWFQRQRLQQLQALWEADLRARDERLAAREERIGQLENEIASYRQRQEQLQDQVRCLEVEKAQLSTRLAEAHRASEEQRQLLEQAQQKLSDTFKALSDDALKSNSQLLLQIAKQELEKQQQAAQNDLEARQRAIDELIRPLRETLDKVEQNLKQVEQNHAGVREQLRLLSDLQQSLRAETQNLVQALRTPSARGRWGEIQLRRVVELAGMVNHCDFTEQASVDSDDGKLRPDMIIHLPNGRKVVVDAKVSLKAYLESLEAKDEETRQACLREHARQVREHLRQLQSKRYWEQFDPAPEFVVAFLPGEVFFSAALQCDPELIEFAVTHKVILATPTTLIALLKAVSYGWQEQQLTESAKEIRELGRSLYERLGTWTEHLVRVSKSLEKLVDDYNKAVSSLERRVLPAARRFQELGIASSREIAELRPLDRGVRSWSVGEWDEALEPAERKLLAGLEGEAGDEF